MNHTSPTSADACETTRNRFESSIQRTRSPRDLLFKSGRHGPDPDHTADASRQTKSTCSSFARARTAFSNSDDATTQKHQLGACAWTIAAFRCAVLFCFRSSRPFLVQASKIMNTPRPPQRAAALLCCLLLAMVALSRAALFDIDLLNTDASVTVRMYVL